MNLLKKHLDSLLVGLVLLFLVGHATAYDLRQGRRH